MAAYDATPASTIGQYLAACLEDKQVLFRVVGRATLHNSRFFQDFVESLMQQHYSKFIIDLGQCNSIDSTFIGVLLGIATSCYVAVINSDERHQRSLKTLGVHDMVCIVPQPFNLPANEAMMPLPQKPYGIKEKAAMILKAHELLIEHCSTNQARFGDFVKQLREELNQIAS